MRTGFRLALVLILSVVGGCKTAPAGFDAAEQLISERLLDGPIISPETDPAIGVNIQGPSLIAAPSWQSQPLGKYYLYFADHKGDSIRLAYADKLEGPWKVYQPGALRLEDSGFPTEPFKLPDDWKLGTTLSNFAPAGTPGIPLVAEDATIPHIASPDVHVDESRRQVIMYYHGLDSVGTQKTRIATSEDGIHFSAQPDPVGPAYFRVFEHGATTYALSMPGTFWRSPGGMSPFEKGPQLFGTDQRHTAVYVRGDSLFVFWTKVGDVPERIYMSEIDISGDWMDWTVSRTIEVLRPERPWEGAGLPLEPSYRSAVNVPVNQVRDPAIFEEDGHIYLLYAVQGERGIGIAKLNLFETSVPAD